MGNKKLTPFELFMVIVLLGAIITVVVLGGSLLLIVGLSVFGVLCLLSLIWFIDVRFKIWTKTWNCSPTQVILMILKDFARPMTASEVSDKAIRLHAAEKSSPPVTLLTAFILLLILKIRKRVDHVANESAEDVLDIFGFVLSDVGRRELERGRIKHALIEATQPSTT